MNIAIFSINKDAYSETFIAAHKTLLKGNVFFYYGYQLINVRLEGSDLNLKELGLKKEILRKFSRSYKKSTAPEALLLQSIKENKIDVILVEFGTLAFNLLPLFRICKIPFIVHFHGYDASVYKVIRDCDNYKEVFERVSKVIAVSKVMEKKLIELGCPESKLILNPYGPSDSFFNVKSSKKEEVLLAVGRFVNKKAPLFTILAFSKVLNKYPNSKLILAGDGPLLNMCENFVEYLGICKSVSFPGIITPEKFKSLLSTCRAFVQHSIVSKDGDMEGTPVAIIESQAAGVPVISTFHAGIPDVVIDNITGLLVDEKDVDGMANAMFTLLTDIKLAQKLGGNGRINISKNFTMKQHIDLINNILIEVT